METLTRRVQPKDTQEHQHPPEATRGKRGAQPTALGDGTAPPTPALFTSSLQNNLQNLFHYFNPPLCGTLFQ